MPNGFFSSLKTVAGSPYALIAYVILVLGWVFISYRNSRLKFIGKAINHLPEKDRKTVLLQEYGIYLKEGMSSEHYLRGRKQTYIFNFAMAFIIMVTIIAVVALQQSGSGASQNRVPAGDPPPDTQLCLEIDSIVDHIADGFVPLRGKKQVDSDGSTQFVSTIRLPGTKYNAIMTSGDIMYFAMIYDGGDRTIAYNKYINYTEQIRKCKDDWIIIPALKDTTDGRQMEYTSFVQGDSKITVLFSMGKDSSYAANLLVLTNKKEKQ